MKRWLGSLVAFLLFSFFVYCLGLAIVPQGATKNFRFFRAGNGHMHTRITEAKSFGKVDVLVVGSSYAYRGIDPRYFEKEGIRLFNLGSSAQSPAQTNWLLHHYLPLLKPDKLIYISEPMMFSYDETESALDILSNENPGVHTLGILKRNFNVRTINTFLYSFLYPVLIDEEMAEPRVKGGDTYIQGGYVERKPAFFAPLVLPPSKLEFDPRSLRFFDQSLQDLESKGIECILVVPPLTRSLVQSFSNYHEFEKRVRAKKFRVYDMNTITSLDDSLHFYDQGHLNQAGVEIFNRALISVLQKDSTFSP